jgi:hypothetical protein
VCALHLQAGDTSCHAGLNPSARTANREVWCKVFDHASTDLTDMVPCECLSIWQQHAPDWELFFYLWGIFSSPLLLLGLAMWMYYTPVFCELGLQGVNLKSRNHFATFRISPKDVYERIFDHVFGPGGVDAATHIIRRLEKAKERYHLRNLIIMVRTLD